MIESIILAKIGEESRFLFCIVITGSNHGGGECDHIIKRTNDCQRLSYLVISTFLPLPCHLDQASFFPSCHLDQALARGEISLSRATPCKLRCLDSARHDRGGVGTRHDRGDIS